jgi:diguanylate cyclase (GGDEF)-like protein/PAS domain S-box-containing protein
MPLRDLTSSASSGALSELLDAVCDLASRLLSFRGISVALNGHSGLVHGRSAHFRAFTDDDWKGLGERVGALFKNGPAHRVDETIGIRFSEADAAVMLRAEADHGGTGAATMVALGHAAAGATAEREVVAQTLSALLRTIRAHVHEHSIAQSTLVRVQAMLLNVETLASVGVWEVDPATRALHWSNEVYRIHGLAKGSEPDVETALSFYPEPARSVLLGRFEQTLATGEGYDLTLPFVRADGEHRIVRAIAGSETDAGRVHSVFGVFQDITSQARREEELWWTANHDTLTRLPNRRLFAERLAEACAATQESGRFGVAIIADLDSFKVINDVHGHHVGDRVLAAVADRLTQAAPAAVGRVGGDEFGLVAQDFDSRDEAERAARRLTRDLAFDFAHDARLVPITVTAGACVFSSGTADAAEALRHADIALIHAKRRGRRQIAFYERRFSEELMRRDEVLTRVRTSLARGDIVPYYQPQVDTATGAVIGVEVLARQVIDGRVTAAADFEAAFKDGELAVALGRTILAAVCRDHRLLRTRGIAPPRLSINVAPMEICYMDYARHLLTQFDDHGVPPTEVLVEITEDVLLGRDQEAVHEALDELARYGIRVAFDDFGTGYASLIHLASYPVHQVKVDKRFVADIVTDPVSQAVVRGVVEVSRARAIEVAAEGVETARQLAMLRAIGCDVAQGYHIARPMPFEALARMLTAPSAPGGGPLD